MHAPRLISVKVRARTRPHPPLPPTPLPQWSSCVSTGYEISLGLWKCGLSSSQGTHTASRILLEPGLVPAGTGRAHLLAQAGTDPMLGGSAPPQGLDGAAGFSRSIRRGGRSCAGYPGPLLSAGSRKEGAFLAGPPQQHPPQQQGQQLIPPRAAARSTDARAPLRVPRFHSPR